MIRPPRSPQDGLKVAAGPTISRLFGWGTILVSRPASNIHLTFSECKTPVQTVINGFSQLLKQSFEAYRL
jgi:hypothetical protein